MFWANSIAIRLLLTAAALLLAACSACTRANHTPQLTEAQAIDIANSLARENGYDLSKWQPPNAHYEFVERDCTWSVFYEIIGNAMPGHFLVVVNDSTKHAFLSGGM